MTNDDGDIQLTGAEVEYVLGLREMWIQSLLEGPLISFREWILDHLIPGETVIDPGDPGEE